MKNISICDKCGKDNFKVINSRPTKDGTTYRQKRCLSCDNVIRTIEIDKADFDKFVGFVSKINECMQEVGIEG